MTADMQQLMAQIAAAKARLAALPTTRKLEQLEQARASINAHVGRGGGLNSNRGHDLVDRYNALKETLYGTTEGLVAWVSYCGKYGFDTRHDGYDLFA